MKKFTKLLAVLLAIAVIVCPMVSALSVSADATPGGTYKLEQVDGDTVRLTINSTDGFVVYKAVINCNNPISESDIRLDGYTLKDKAQDVYNLPAIDAKTVGDNTTILVSASNAATLDLYTEVVIEFDVTTGSNVKITNIQAADGGAIEDDPTLLDFPGVANASDGDIDPTAEDYPADAEIKNVHDHVASTTVAAAAATCTTPGTQGYVYCDTCKKYFTNDTFATETTVEAREIAIDPTAHSFTAKPSTTKATDATCTAAATYYVQCDRCDATTTTTVAVGDPAGHNMTPHAATDATCIADGNSAYWSCDRCNKFFSDAQGNTEIAEYSWVIASEGHKASNTTKYPKTPATCKDDAVYYQECSVCHDQLDTTWTDTDSHLAVAHTWGEYVSDNNATCTVDGTKTATCTVCETATDTVTDTDSKLGHNYTYDYEGNGKHVVGCTRCDYSDVEDCVDTNPADGTCDKCGHTAGPVTPVVDNNIEFNDAAVGVDASLQIRIRWYQNYIKSTYASFDCVVVPVKYDSATNFTRYTADPIVLETTGTGKSSISYYTGVAMYELSCDVVTYIRCYDSAGNIVATSNEVTINPADELKKTLATATTNSLKVVITDLLNMSASAQRYFATSATTSDLYQEISTVGYVNAGISQDAASATYGTLNNVESSNWVAGQALTESANGISVLLKAGKAPMLQYSVKKLRNMDQSKVQLRVSFVSNNPKTGTVINTYTGNDFTYNGTATKGTIDLTDSAYYDSNVTITFELSYDGVLCNTTTYSVDTGLSIVLPSATGFAKTLYEDVAKFNNSARVYTGYGV